MSTKKQKTAGAPTKPAAEKCVKFSVSVPPDVAEYLTKIGGKPSEGVRRLSFYAMIKQIALPKIPGSKKS